MTWRSFVDHGAIVNKWQAGTGTFYVIDHKGVIRYKWLLTPGEKAIDAALEKLIKEAEGTVKTTPK